MSIYACDIETTGLLQDLLDQGEDKRMHNFGAKNADHEILFSQGWNVLNSRACEDIRPLSELQGWLDEGHTLVMHNGLCYDGEALAMFGYDLSANEITDTLYLAWYLEPLRNRYGLADYGEIFGIPKPLIENWQGLSQEEYNFRVMQDCRIQLQLWERQVEMFNNLYDNDQKQIKKMIDYLMSKGRHLRAAQRVKWKLDIEGCQELSKELHIERTYKREALIRVMPKMPVYKSRVRIKKPFKMNGLLSKHGESWLLFCLEYGVDWDSYDEYKYLAGWEEGNPNSHAQVKAWLFDLGWEPETFNYTKDAEGNERKVPQINVKDSNGKLDPGIERMLDEYEDLQHLAGLGIINHRISIADGWLNSHVDGYITARAAGFTNTLRLRHGGIVNVPSTRVSWGKELRSLLIADDGYVLLGSDLSSLEDRCKHHYQMPLDPDYVNKQMHPEFDPHMTIAVMGDFLTESDHTFYLDMEHGRKELNDENKKKLGQIKPIRNLGKRTNYGCQYGAYPPRLARDAKIPIETAQKLFDAYWALNWSINEIAESTETKSCNGVTWQRNPVNGFWYHLKTNKDKFSTLCQGTGAYVFDTWVEQMFQICLERWGREPMLNGQFHDEVILSCKNGTESIWDAVVEEAMERTNILLGMRREMACETQFDTKYSGIH